MGTPTYNAQPARVVGVPTLVHDVLEDTDHSIDHFPQRVRVLVDLLTRRKGRNRVGSEDESKIASLERLAASNDREAILIKAADRYDNLREGMATMDAAWLHGYLDTSRRIHGMTVTAGWGASQVVHDLETLVAEAQRRCQ